MCIHINHSKNALLSFRRTIPFGVCVCVWALVAISLSLSLPPHFALHQKTKLNHILITFRWQKLGANDVRLPQTETSSLMPCFLHTRTHYINIFRCKLRDMPAQMQWGQFDYIPPWKPFLFCFWRIRCNNISWIKAVMQYNRNCLINVMRKKERRWQKMTMTISTVTHSIGVNEVYLTLWLDTILYHEMCAPIYSKFFV